MIGILLAKDLRRTLRNPWPWLLNLSLPLAITALIGFAFGGSGKRDSDLGRIKLAVVDEDQSYLSRALRSGLTQEKAAEHLEAIFVDRAEALRILRENQISAILVVPKSFMSRYLQGESGVKLEVIKNPAQTYMPAIVEELAAVAVTGLNAISRNLNSEFPKIRAAFTNDWGMDQFVEIAERVGERIKAARANLDPPLVGYQKDVKEKSQAGTAAKKAQARNPIVDVFGYILPGMASAFLLFIADQAMRDFHREVRMKTLDRQRTIGSGVAYFIAGKILFAAITVFLGAAILFGAGTAVFGIHWNHPGLLALACAAYSLFGAGFLASLSALAPSERRADALNSMLLFAIAFAGGSYVPSENFPKFMREHVTVLMPNHWMIEVSRSLQRGGADYLAPLLVVAKLAIVGVVLGVVAAFVIERKLTSGSRA